MERLQAAAITSTSRAGDDTTLASPKKETPRRYTPNQQRVGEHLVSLLQSSGLRVGLPDVRMCLVSARVSMPHNPAWSSS